jgi:hypothetical protein
MRRSTRLSTGLALLCALPACGLPVAVPARGQEPAAAAPAAPAANLPAFTRWIIAADYTRDGAQLLTAGGESLLYRPGDVVVWNAADGNRIGDLAGHPTAVWAVKASKDGKLAATAGYDGLVKLWDLPARTLKADLKKHKGWVRSLDFSPDGTRLATGGEDGTVVVWNTADGAEVRAITAHAAAATCLGFSPDGATLATGGGDKLVKLWNAADGAEKAKLEGHGDALWTLAWSPDGTKIVSGGADRSAKIWNTADNKELGTLAGHKDWVTSAAFNPDGSRLATASLDGVVKMWDVASRGEQEGPEAVKSSLWAVVFAPDGKSLFIGSHAGGRIVPVPEPKLLPPPPPPPPQPQWVALVPTAFASAAGATAAIGADGVVLVTGNRAKDTYTLKAVVPAGGNLRGVRLEALADDSLPGKGPGRADNGNFVVSTFGVQFGPAGSAETPTAIAFAAAKADFEQENYGVAGTIDDKPDSGWAIGGGTGATHLATYDLPADLVVPATSPLTVTIDQQHADGTHAVGKFRLHLLQEVPPPAPAPAAPPAAPAPEAPKQ